MRAIAPPVLALLVACSTSPPAPHRHSAGTPNDALGSSGAAGARGVDEASGGTAGEASDTNVGGETAVGGETVTGPGVSTNHCAGLPDTCGPDSTRSCCASHLVPGGTFNRDGVPVAPATVSSFKLDDYEVTVGRIRQFLAVYSPEMLVAGAGKNPHNAADPGWNPAWNVNLPSVVNFPINLRCKIEQETWTDTPGANENLPINCIDWYEANAFCIWDGGRLPTSTEWFYAATGGDEQREYPWATAADQSGIDDEHAVLCGPSCRHPQTVGSRSPRGDGRWGQSDLMGNVWEWVQDSFEEIYGVPCIDCANLAESAWYTQRGGSYLDDPTLVRLITRHRTAPAYHAFHYGLRCARDP